MSDDGEDIGSPVVRIGVEAHDHASVNALGQGLQINIERVDVHDRPRGGPSLAQLTDAYFQGVLRNPKIRQWQGDRTADYYDLIIPGRAEAVDLPSRTSLRDREVSLQTLIDQAGTTGERARILVLGDPGSGKTTALQYQTLRQALRFAEGQPYVPVVPVPLNHYSGNLSQTVQAAVNDVSGLNLTVDSACSFVQEGGCVLCFDGLNELGAFRDQGVREISTLISSSPQLAFVITCRWDEYGDDFEWDLGWRILPLRAVEIEEYMTWHAGERGTELYREIMQDRSLVDVSSNPLILRMLREAAPAGPLPTYRGQLYAMFANTMLRRQGAKDLRGAQIPFEVRRRALEELAHRMQHKNVVRYSARQVANVFIGFLTSWHETYPWRLLLNSSTSSGLLVHENGSYTFLHQSIQEYFAAAAIEDRSLDGIGGDNSVLGSTQWNDVLLLLAGITRNPSELLKRLIVIDPVMAVKCISHGASADTGLMDALLRELGRMAVSPSWVVRRTSADLMGELGWPSAHSVLLTMLRDENDEVRWGAVHALRNIGVGGVAIPALIERLHDRFWVTRGETAVTLAQLSVVQAIPAVGEMLACSNSYVSACATHSLVAFYEGSQEGRAGVTALLTQVTNEQRELVLFAISVAEAGTERTARLEEALGSASVGVVEAAIRLLLTNPGPDSADKIASFVSSVHASVRATAVSALGKLQARRHVQLVGWALLADEGEQVRGTAATALGEMYADDAAGFLLRAVGDNSAEVRFAVARSLGRLRVRAGRSQLQTWAAEDPDVRVRVHAIRALGFLGGWC